MTRLFAKLVDKEQCTDELDEFTPVYAEISDIGVGTNRLPEGSFFLFYYNKDGKYLSDDYCFSLNEAMELVKCHGDLEFTANGYWVREKDLCEQVESCINIVEIEWSCDCPEILKSLELLPTLEN